MKMIKVGIERIDAYLDLFKNKKVGLITNPTGVDSKLKSTIDILNELTNLTSLYSPEHGVRGDLQAGVRLDDYRDPLTGCFVYSLYGKNKKPTKEMLENIDVLCFDIQDVGARYYTFIYTMAYAMMACKEHGKQMIVFDRPNPVNATSVEGNILDINFRSFVGYYPIVQRYGLTIGELAHFFNQEYDINCDLTVVEMDGYKREMAFHDTHFNWVFPSPNLPTINSTYAYLATCLFEGTNMSEGRGTTKPFSIIGSPYLKHLEVIKKIETHNLPGIAFRPLHFTPTFSKHQGILCKGIELIITDKHTFRPVKTGYILLDIIKHNHSEFEFRAPYKEGHNPMFDLLTGCNYIRQNEKSLSEQLDIIEKDSKLFETKKRRYHLYD